MELHDEILLSAKKLVYFLSAFLGESYEIVLHSIDNKNIENSKIVAIANEQISHRNLNSPITSFALDLLKNEVYKEKDYVLNYNAETSDKREIRGSTFFIKNNKNEIAAMLCINFDPSKYLKTAEEVLQLANITESPFQQRPKEPSETEYLTQTVEDIVYSTIDSKYLDNDVILTPTEKEKIIKELQHQKVFLIKG